jgi:hypothetical protein
MKRLLRTCLACFLSVLLLGCIDPDSGPSRNEHPTAKSGSGIHEDARKVILEYANRYEQIYLQHEGSAMLKRLSEVTGEYNKRMAKLAEEGKWTPQHEIGRSIKLSFLIGQFHGALQSCKVEKAHKDETLVGCEKAQELKHAMEELCSE